MHREVYNKIIDLLVCPNCETKLELTQRGLYCRNCEAIHPFKKGILSFLSKEEDCWQRFFLNRLKRGHNEAWTVGYLYMRNFKLVQNTIRKIVNNPFNLRILDIGCGHGLMSGWLSHHNTVVGVDFVMDMLIYAEQNGLIPIHADGMKLPFKKKSFDIVMAIEVIQHVNNGEKFISYLSQFVSNRGKILISGPSNNSLLRKIYRRIHKFVNLPNVRKPIPHLCEPIMLAKPLRNLGFDTKMTYSCFPFNFVLEEKESKIKKHPIASNFFIVGQKL